MTSRPVPSTADPVATDTPVAGPGARPHLPPVAPATSTATTTSRRSRKAPLAWLPWLLLGLLALTLLAVALLARAADGGADRAAGSDAPARSDAQASSGDAGAAGDAALSAGGRGLLAVRGGQLSSLEGQSAQGTAKVESVVADEGFWVGDDASDRVFVLLTPEARRSAGESGFQVEAGQTVSLKGTVKGSSPEFAESAGVTDAEGSRQLVEQGAYVEATEVQLAQ